MLGCNQGESRRAATDGRCLETTVCRSLTEAGTDGRPFTTAQVLVTVNANDQRLHRLLISGFLTCFHSEQSCEVKKAPLCFSLCLLCVCCCEQTQLHYIISSSAGRRVDEASAAIHSVSTNIAG